MCIYREVGKLQKKVVIIQTSLEQRRLEKHNMLLDCKVQDIEIRLLSGSLDDIIEVEVTQQPWLVSAAPSDCLLSLRGGKTAFPARKERGKMLAIPFSGRTLGRILVLGGLCLLTYRDGLVSRL